MPSRFTLKRSTSSSKKNAAMIEKALTVILAFQSLQTDEGNLNVGNLGTFKEDEAEHLRRTIEELARKHDKISAERVSNPESFGKRKSPSRFQKTLRRFRKKAARMTGMRGTFSNRGNVPSLNQ